MPACTEIVCGLGLRGQLVGRSHECDYPADVAHLPVCTAPKIDAEAGSAEIDRQVKGLLQDALSLYRVDTEKLKELRPDFILTQAQCEVCAVNLPEVEKAVAAWVGAKPRVLSFSPQKLAQVWEEMREMAEALGASDEGKNYLRRLKNHCVDVIERACMVAKRPNVACIEWLDPLMAAGNWVPELVELAAGKNLFGEPGKHSPWLKWNAIVKSDPDIIVVMACGFDIARSRREMPALTRQPGWNKLKAVKKERVYLVDGNQYFNRPGPRLVESLEILAELFHPALFPAKYHGRGWVQWKPN